jgi:type IV pilus assembly protein PilF
LRLALAAVVAGVLVLASACAATGPANPGGANRSAAEINVQLGVGYLQQNRLDLAHEKLTRALEQDPRLPSAHMVIAVLYEHLREIELAEKHYRRAVTLDPKDSAAQNNLGRFLCTQGKLVEAERHFLVALQDPLYATPEVAHTNAGICAKRKPDVVKAERHLRSALQANPRYAPALIEMAKLAYEQEQYLPARAYLERYSGVVPHDAESLWLGIRIERKLGDQNAVASYALRLKANFPDSEETQWLLRSE